MIANGLTSSKQLPHLFKHKIKLGYGYVWHRAFWGDERRAMNFLIFSFRLAKEQ
jgi:hypothetical protein